MARLKRDEEELPATGRTVANSTSVITMDLEASGNGSPVGPAGVTVSTVAKWLKVRDDGTDYFIPMWS